MQMVLAAYSTHIFREFRLPAIDNANHTLRLLAAQFGLRADLHLQLEVIDGVWHALAAEGYTIFSEQQRCERFELKEKQPFFLRIEEENRDIHFILNVQDDVLNRFERYSLQNVQAVTIGRDPNCTIQYNYLGMVGRQHARILRIAGGFAVEDTDSKNGVFIKNKRVKGMQKLEVGDSIDILGLKLVYFGDLLLVNATACNAKVSGDLPALPPDEGAVAPLRPRKAKTAAFRRTPRVITALHTEAVEIEEPPPPNQEKRQPLFMTIGPAFTMMIPMLLGSGVAIFGANASGGGASVYMYTGIITAVAAGVIGVVWALINMNYSKKNSRKEEERRGALYRDYLVDIEDRLKKEYAENGRILHEKYPSAKECCKYGGSTLSLWNRNATHEDFLFARLGLGAVPFQVAIEIPKKRFTLISDSLADKPRMIKEEYSTLNDVPVGIDFRKSRLTGIYGNGESLNSILVARSLAVQIAASNCYTDVKLVFLYGAEHAEEWSFAKWLPHVWSQDGKMRYVAADKREASDVLYALGSVLRARSEQIGFEKAEPKPYYIVFAESADILEGEPAAKFLLEPGNNTGVSTVFLADGYEALPNGCTLLIQNDSAFCGMYHALASDGNKVEVNFDRVSSDEAELFARRLSGIHVNETETGGEIPVKLDFFEMYGIKKLDDLHVTERWKKNRTYENMRALIGQKGGGTDVYLDIHEKYHGPHGLVAGTTGSGKSETLQTFLLSLAINFSPLDVGFFIIDYKGGGMANLFSGLPHMVGQISNLSGNQVRRAMVSIKSEIKRRQRIFGEYEVNHLDMYTRLLKNNEASVPLPHLIIIVDEFAELKREEPDFMRELVSVAQVGRSLGIHLVLATQRPAGTVDDNIWSNSKFRLCLRVQDKQDSMDILKKPDAAAITQAGRGFLQVGNDEIFELFQSGWSGAVYDEDLLNTKTELAIMLTRTGQSSVVGNKNKMKIKEQKRTRWMAALTECVRAELEKSGRCLSAALADANVRKEIVQGVFDGVRGIGLDYQESQYNERRLDEFLSVLEKVGLPECADEAWVAKIVVQAARMGVKLPELKERTQLSAVVEYLGDTAAVTKMQTALSLWLPPLGQKICLSDLPDSTKNAFDGKVWPSANGAWTLEATVGLCDDPVNQAQLPVLLNFAEDGHTVICGMVVSGKTTLLQTLLFSLVSRYAPDALSLYILDYNSRSMDCFRGLAHCGGVAFEDEPAKTGKFFAMITRELERRKRLFQGGNYAQYANANGAKEPAIVIAIDGFANFREKTDNAYEDILIKLSREGANFGVYLVLTAAGFSASEVNNRIGENIKTVFALQMGDLMKYSDALHARVDTLPETGVVGRGLVMVHGVPLEFQSALCLDAEDDYRRTEAIRERFRQMNAAWSGPVARPIPEVPKEPVWKDLTSLADYQASLKDSMWVPFAYFDENADLCGVDLKSTFTYLVAGRSRTGKTNVLRCLMRSAADRGGDIAAIDSAAGDLAYMAGKCGARYVKTEAELELFARELYEEMVLRNREKRRLSTQGLSDDKIFDAMRKYRAMHIFVDNLEDFITRLYAPVEQMQAIVPFIENFLEKGALHNIYLYGALGLEGYAALSAYRSFDLLLTRRTGILLGGNMMNQRLFDMSGLPYQEQNRVYGAGVGFLPPYRDVLRPMKIVVPLIGGEEE